MEQIASRRFGRKSSGKRGSDRAALDEELEGITQGVGRLAVRVWDRQLNRLIRIRGLDKANEVFRQDPIAEQRGMHTIIRGLSDTKAFPIRKAINAVRAAAEAFGASSDPGFEIIDTATRERAYERAIVRFDARSLPVDLRRSEIVPIEVSGIANRLVGSTRREVHQEDVERRPYRLESGETDLSGYRPGRDTIGSSGVESAFDRRLHGSIGDRRAEPR